jgi:hypothetical protein
VTIVGNDASSFIGDYQLWMQTIVSGSTIARNSFGPATSAGVVCYGHDNWFVNNHFYGTYPGWPPSTGPGLFWFPTTSRANIVEATKLNTPPHGTDICGQVLNETIGANLIRGYEKCGK